MARHLTKDRSQARAGARRPPRRRRRIVADLKGLVEAIAKALADQPDAVRVGESERRGMTVIELQVAPGDLGRVIGRQGRTAAAVRRCWPRRRRPTASGRRSIFGTARDGNEAATLPVTSSRKFERPLN